MKMSRRCRTCGEERSPRRAQREIAELYGDARWYVHIGNHVLAITLQMIAQYESQQLRIALGIEEP